MSIINTANSTLTGGARNAAAATLRATRGGTGLLAKAGSLAASGLKLFAGLSPIGKAATLAVGALGVSKLVGGHPAGQRVG